MPCGTNLLLFWQRREQAPYHEVYPGHGRVQLLNGVRQQPGVDPHAAVGGVKAGGHLRQQVLERVQFAGERL